MSDDVPTEHRHRGGLRRGRLRTAILVSAFVLMAGVVLALVSVQAGQRDEPSARLTASTDPSDSPSSEPSDERSSEPSNPGPGPTSTPTRWRTTARPGIPAGITSSRQPTAIRLPDGEEMDVRKATTDAEGELVVPDDVDVAGWWDGGARVSDPFGTMVIAAHVDSEIQGLGPFSALLSAAEGDAVEALTQEANQTYVVSSVTRIPRDSLTERDDLFTSSGPHQLVLLTCAGDFIPQQGGYQDLAVVVAEPLERTSG